PLAAHHRERRDLVLGERSARRGAGRDRPVHRSRRLGGDLGLHRRAEPGVAASLCRWPRRPSRRSPRPWRPPRPRRSTRSRRPSRSRRPPRTPWSPWPLISEHTIRGQVETPVRWGGLLHGGAETHDVIVGVHVPTDPVLYEGFAHAVERLEIQVHDRLRTIGAPTGSGDRGGEEGRPRGAHSSWTGPDPVACRY